MVTLKKFQEIHDRYHELKRAVQSITINPFGVSVNHEKTPHIRTDKGLSAERAKVAEGMLKAIPLLESRIELQKEMDQILPLNGYINITAKCTTCGKDFDTNHNVYQDFDFSKANCPYCEAALENKENAEIISKAKNLRPKFNRAGDLVEIALDHDGKEYRIHGVDDEDSDSSLVLEEVDYA